jgi:hypothetical protein
MKAGMSFSMCAAEGCKVNIPHGYFSGNRELLPVQIFSVAGARHLFEQMRAAKIFALGDTTSEEFQQLARDAGLPETITTRQLLEVMVTTGDKTSAQVDQMAVEAGESLETEFITDGVAEFVMRATHPLAVLLEELQSLGLLEMDGPAGSDIGDVLVGGRSRGREVGRRRREPR